MTLEEAEASQRIPVADCQMRSFSAQHAGSRPLGQKSSKRILSSSWYAGIGVAATCEPGLIYTCIREKPPSFQQACRDRKSVV